MGEGLRLQGVEVVPVGLGRRGEVGAVLLANEGSEGVWDSSREDDGQTGEHEACEDRPRQNIPEARRHPTPPPDGSSGFAGRC